MNSRVAFPFLIVPENAVNFGGWMIGDPGAPLLPAENILPGWDYERDLEVKAKIAIDCTQVSKSLGIPLEDMRLAIVMKMGTGTGKIPRRMDVLTKEHIDCEQSEFTLSAQIPSYRLSSRLRLEVAIVLGEQPRHASILSPVIQGARLWSSQRDILLEDGGDSRFPVEMVCFSECFKGLPQVYAPWYVLWKRGSYDSDFAGAVRLYVNSDFPDVKERFIDGDPLTLQSILASLMSQLITSAISDDEFDQSASDCQDGSVGHQIRAWLDNAFPGQSTMSIRSLKDRQLGQFQASILAAAEVGEGV